ncbi:hybrid sensor histidine kinase/response regulator [filamentous cyanobacterium CCP1]|nr:hybrid sensor histidine kinase/response regulator [filamentous cyanobacterium CCP2]PSB67504.1 hybrid sensor histidine kinase/response regulator [filamentous cyanobacterium CCP1]
MLRILLIDDSQADRLLAIRELRRTISDVQIQEVCQASDFEPTLEAGEFDLVILDYQLRWNNGLTILQSIKSRYPNCPVIMFTNSGSEEIAVEGMKQGLSDYVLKGKPLHRLTIAVQESLNKERLRQDYENAQEQLKLSEERFRRQTQELEKANQLKDEFLAVLSHELRTPLNPILGWVKLLRRGNLDAARVSYALETIERNAELQTQLIEDLLDISRILRGKLSFNMIPVDLVQIIGAALETVRLAAEAKRIQLETHLEPRGRFVSGDSARLQQIIWNILSNAIKFTPEGGKVEVSLNYVDLYARITVKDTGKGIAPEFLPYVFEYFRQADSSTTRNFGGLGLGLAIASHLTEMHGGSVRAESPGVGKGATFTIMLPLLTANSEIIGVPISVESVANLQGVKVLVVDDERDNLEILSFILESAGATVTAVTSAREALTAFLQLHPDVLVSDIGMPEMDGYALIQQLQALLSPSNKPLLSIALTAYAGEVNQKQALAAGFKAHLSKPVDPIELVAAIAEQIRSSVSSSDR